MNYRPYACTRKLSDVQQYHYQKLRYLFKRIGASNKTIESVKEKLAESYDDPEWIENAKKHQNYVNREELLEIIDISKEQYDQEQNEPGAWEKA